MRDTIFKKLIKSRTLTNRKFKILVTFGKKRHEYGRNTCAASNIGNECSNFEFISGFKVFSLFSYFIIDTFVYNLHT